MENSKYTALSKNTKPNKDLIQFIKENVSKDKTIIDWGAGHGRHSKALRDLGYKVWSYDPYNGEDTFDGYNKVSIRLPEKSHDVIFSAYVLNVLNRQQFSIECLLMTNKINKEGLIIHKVREDKSLLEKIEKEKKEIVCGRKNSIQRFVSKEEFYNIGYERNNKNKLYYCNF